MCDLQLVFPITIFLHSCASVAIESRLCEPPATLMASGRTLVTHSALGRPTLRTYWSVAGRKVFPTKLTFLNGFPGVLRMTLPKSNNCLWRIDSEKGLHPALLYTVLFEMRDTNAAGIPRICRKHLHWNPSLVKLCHITMNLMPLFIERTSRRRKNAKRTERNRQTTEHNAANTPNEQNRRRKHAKSQPQ